MSQRDSFSAFPIRFALSLSFLPARLIRTLPIEFRPKRLNDVLLEAMYTASQ